jgi:hypothetical protein
VSRRRYRDDGSGKTCDPGDEIKTSMRIRGLRPSMIAAAVAGKCLGEKADLDRRRQSDERRRSGGETKYPDLDCTGKLIRVGASKSYAFFIEVITNGAAKKGGRWPDGTITRAGDNLA